MELAFAAITPRSLATSRTGGIIARLLAQKGLEFVGTRMYAPSDDFVDAYIRILGRETIPSRYKQAYLEYIESDLRPAAAARRGYTNRLLVLFFRGKKAERVMKDLIGDHCPPPSGLTVRGTFGDYAVDEDGRIHDFHPAALTAYSAEGNRAMLRLLADYAELDGGVVEGVIPQEQGVRMETTLVMIKPDNLERPSSLPGHIIDLFGTTGLFIVGARLVSMSIEQALRFYGFLEDIFVDKLAWKVEDALRGALPAALNFELDDEDYAALAGILRRKNAHAEVAKIVEYMTGLHPDRVGGKAARKSPGPARCFALLYRGENAVNRIRQKLGATDPRSAEAGTVRSDYGHDLMHNGAHASDSVASALREREIVGLVGNETSEERRLVLEWLRSANAKKKKK